MICKICGTTYEGGGAFCAACLSRLKAAGSLADSLGKTPPQPVSAPMPARRAGAREVWAFQGEVKFPLAAAAHPAEGTVVLDQPEGYRILHLSPAGKLQAQLFQIPQGSKPGELDDPQGLFLAEEGTLYVADSGNDRIAIWNADGSFRQTIDDLARPTDVWVDEDGYLCVAEAFRGRVQKLTPEGLSCLEITEAGGWGRLNEPVAVALDRSLNIYVADRGRGLVVQFSSEGVPLRCWPGPERIVFEDLRDVDVGPDGSVWIGDRENTRVHRFAVSGGLLGCLERTPEPDLGFEGGTLGLQGSNVVIPDRLNDRVICLTFEK